MNKKEFLKELENALDGRLSSSDIQEIISDYGDVFNNGMADGKAEEDIAKEIGSPAKIARTILEDVSDAGRGEHGDFQQNTRGKVGKILDQVTQPAENVPFEQLAPMSTRLWAAVIDALALIVLILMLYFPLSDGGPRNYMLVSFSLFPVLVLLGGLNFFMAIILWATNGYTPGKWFLSVRVVKINGSRISFLDAFLREGVMKGIVNGLFSGLLNLASFIWGCATDDHKTVHDLVVKTRVVKWNRSKAASSEAHNPLEDTHNPLEL